MPLPNNQWTAYMYESMPEQYCIRSIASKSVWNCVNWGGNDNKYDCQASKFIFNFSVESRQTHVLILILTILWP